MSEDQTQLINSLKAEVYDVQKRFETELGQRNAVLVQIASKLGFDVENQNVPFNDLLARVDAVMANQKKKPGKKDEG